ncbi:Phage tail fiber protein [Kosakonia radicincitans]|uniref:phage tail protein n=1 Tax=Kosakonia radicincitans TaxID=283686 RepID=UPI0011832998|nr:phage tail protein [Kosakonia radicincitans]VVT52689.1 Phage tail fiber protein [Kosakonia radicincitans]
MHRIDTPTAQVDKFGAGKNGFTAGNPQTGTPATDLDEAFFDTLQEELAAVIENAGIALDKTQKNQLLTALQTSFQSRDATLTAIAALTGAANKLAYFNGADTAALTDLTSVGRDIIGQSSVANLLSYLGLGDGSALPVGTPIPWATSTPPTGWLKCNGATFTAAQYPKLALAYPGLVLPDLRGEFIRGWDDGRGLDSGRAILSAQTDAIRNITASVSDIYGGGLIPGTPAGAFTGSAVSGTGPYYTINTTSGASRSILALAFNASNSVPTASENRPVNIAFNYIVRAA